MRMDPVVFMIPIAVVAIGFIVASSRRGSVSGTQIGTRMIELHTPADPATVFGRLRALGGKYRTDDSDPAQSIIVLSSSPTFATWGFLYPVHIHATDSGSRIVIGIQSRFVQWGPLVTSAHKQCAKAIEDVLGVPTARVA